jgi:lipoprotein signal peptidase
MPQGRTDLLFKGGTNMSYTFSRRDFMKYTALAAAAVANYLITPGLLCAVLMGLAALVITNGLQILLMTYQQGVAFSAASSLAGREILVTLPLTVLVYLPFRWVRRRIYSE